MKSLFNAFRGLYGLNYHGSFLFYVMRSLTLALTVFLVSVFVVDAAPLLGDMDNIEMFLNRALVIAGWIIGIWILDTIGCLIIDLVVRNAFLISAAPDEAPSDDEYPEALVAGMTRLERNTPRHIRAICTANDTTLVTPVPLKFARTARYTAKAITKTLKELGVGKIKIRRHALARDWSALYLAVTGPQDNGRLISTKVLQALTETLDLPVSSVMSRKGELYYRVSLR